MTPKPAIERIGREEDARHMQNFWQNKPKPRNARSYQTADFVNDIRAAILVGGLAILITSGAVAMAAPWISRTLLPSVARMLGL